MADNVAKPAPFILKGIMPFTALVHKKALTFLAVLCRREESLER
jgi:hypothetical protein